MRIFIIFLVEDSGGRSYFKILTDKPPSKQKILKPKVEDYLLDKFDNFV